MQQNFKHGFCFGIFLSLAAFINLRDFIRDSGGGLLATMQDTISLISLVFVGIALVMVLRVKDIASTAIWGVQSLILGCFFFRVSMDVLREAGFDQFSLHHISATLGFMLAVFIIVYAIIVIRTGHFPGTSSPPRIVVP